MPADRIQESDAASGCLQIDDWRYYVASHELEHNGETIRLEPRAAGLLLYLANRAGQAVSRAALLEALWPGMVVSDEALTNAVNKLRRAFGDDRANPRVIETLPKTGYRLIAPVRPLAPVQPAPVPGQAGARSVRRRLLLVAAAVLLGLGALLFTALALRTPGPGAGGPARDSASDSARPALAVLPFDNLSAETAGEYLADGITDDVITRLAKQRGLMVIARDSTFFYKGKSLELDAIAENLGVGYVLRGSVRREGGLLKINVWLVDAASGDHLWAEHYERKSGQVIDVQNDVARSVATALALEADGHAEGDEATRNPQAYDNLLLGRYHFYKFQSRAENLKARACFEEAVRLDPEYATAHAMLAWTYAFAAMNGWADDRPAALQQAGRIASRAIEIQPRLSLAYYVRGLSYREQHEYVKALVEAQKAIEYDPNDANGHVLLATLLYYAGRPREGLARILEAMQINPHHPYNYHFHLGQAYFVLHRYQDAIAAFRRGLSSNPASQRMRVWLAAALAQSGDIEAAQWEAEQVLAANSDFSLQRISQAFPFKDPADVEHFLAGLRLAGLQ